MAPRPGPHPPSLMAYMAREAEHVMRLEAADPHRGRERGCSTKRPDRFTHPTSRMPSKITLPREASIDCRPD